MSGSGSFEHLGQITVQVRDDAQGIWMPSFVASSQGVRSFEVRHLAVHRDRVTGVDRLIAALTSGSVFSGGYDAGALGRIRWNPEPELSGRLARIMSCGSANGDAYLVVLDRHESPTRSVYRAALFLNRGDGTFELKPTTFSGLDSTGISGEAADLNNDGLLDIVIACDPDNSGGGLARVGPERYNDRVYVNTGAHGAREPLAATAFQRYQRRRTHRRARRTQRQWPEAIPLDSQQPRLQEWRSARCPFRARQSDERGYEGHAAGWADRNLPRPRRRQNP
jgi:hypothetical protein